jgi:dihydrolipoamide dehydrogenase
MDHFDFVIIGAGPAGEAAANEARARGASVAVVDRDLFGGSCPHWGCIPSKTLLHAAAIHAEGGAYDWARASARRDYMINREGRDYPDDAGHIRSLEGVGATVFRGEASVAGAGRVTVRRDGTSRELAAANVIIAVGSQSKVPPIEGIETVRVWTNKDATRPRAAGQLAVLGGADRVEPPRSMPGSGSRHDRPVRSAADPSDHPATRGGLQALRRDGLTVRLGVRRRVRKPPGWYAMSSTWATMTAGGTRSLAVGRTFPLRARPRTVGTDVTDRTRSCATAPPDADGVYPRATRLTELHTQAHYQGRRSDGA